MKSLLVHCWRGNDRIKNLGEWFIDVIFAKLGYTARYYPAQRREPDEPCLLVIGSDCRRELFDPLLAECSEVWVWGQGYGWGTPVPVTDPRYAERVRVFALRGPITAKLCDVRGVPLCDPGFLMPWALPIERITSRGRANDVLYIPHWEERGTARERLAAMGATDFIDVLMTGENVVLTIERIIGADFVLTSTLHTMILCLAYRVPCALHLPKGRAETNMPKKWCDVFATMNTDPPPSALDLADGMDWWRSTGRHLKLPDTQPLLNAFPHELAR